MRHRTHQQRHDEDGQFLEALHRLAVAAEEQSAYLRQLGTASSADKLALEYLTHLRR
jgi:hypothetical protein